MGKFTTRLRFKHISPTRIQLTSPLVFVGKDQIFRVPVGFKSDGLSIPTWAQWFQKPLGFGLEAGVLHDFILECPTIPMSFLEANDIFDDALKSLGMGWWKRNTLELATDFNAVFVHGNDKPNNWLQNQK